MNINFTTLTVAFAAGFVALAYLSMRSPSSQAPTNSVEHNLTSAEIDRIACEAHPGTSACRSGKTAPQYYNNNEFANATNNLNKTLDNVRNTCSRAGGVYDSATNRCMNVPGYGMLQ